MWVALDALSFLTDQLRRNVFKSRQKAWRPLQLHHQRLITSTYRQTNAFFFYIYNNRFLLKLKISTCIQIIRIILKLPKSSSVTPVLSDLSFSLCEEMA